jgi:hypothetical protein
MRRLVKRAVEAAEVCPAEIVTYTCRSRSKKRTPGQGLPVSPSPRPPVSPPRRRVSPHPAAPLFPVTGRFTSVCAASSVKCTMAE